MATAAKKVAPKAAPAPVEVEVGSEIEVGASYRFLGYGDDVPEAEQFLTTDEVYEAIGVTEPEGDDPGGDPIFAIPNPEYNPKKKEHPETNPKLLEVSALPEEIELVEAEAEAVEEAAAEAAPAAPAKKTAAKATAKAEAAPAAKPATAKPAAKTAAKAAVPAKGAAKPAKPAKAVAPPPEPVDEDALPDLDNEDAEVVALVEGNEGNLIAVAQELEAQVGTAEYQLGGILYHLRKSKGHHGLDGGEAYEEKGGWAKFLTDHFNIDYRKAMYLIEIYVNFTLAGIEDPAARVATIGWTKASKIAKLLNVEGHDAAELLALAEESTVADLSTAITEQTSVGGTKGEKGEKKTRLTIKFRFFEEEAKTVDSILATAKEQFGLADIGEALVQILGEWASANAGGEATVESAPKQTAKVVAKPAVKRAVAKA